MAPVPTPVLRVPAVALALTLALAACGSDPADDAAETAEPGAGITEPATGPTWAEPDPGETPAAPDTNVTDGCVEEYRHGTDYFPDRVAFEQSSAIDVAYHDHYKIVEVALPGGETVPYVLLQCGTPDPRLDGELARAQVIEIPVDSVVSLTTTNLPHFAEIGEVDRLVGVGTAGFVATPEVVERIETGAIGEYADETGQPDLERLVADEPGILFLDGFGDTVLDDVGRLVDAGVPTVALADFDEQTPLGRAEWVKFTALFLNAERRAEEAYGAVADRYHERRESAQHAPERPRVLVNEPYEGTWFVPRGDSYVAALITDAGGEYVFADEAGAGAAALDIETVIDAAADADVWIQAGSVEGTLEDLLASDQRFASFRAFDEGEVWAWDRWTTPGGGNALFEVAYTRADLLLDDLVAILHPGSRDDMELTFYGRVPPAR